MYNRLVAQITPQYNLGLRILFMIKISVLALILLTSFQTFGAEQNSLFGPDTKHGGFGSLVFKASPMNNSSYLFNDKNYLAFFMGIKGGWIINENYSIGAAMNFLLNRQEEELEYDAQSLKADEISTLKMGYYGLTFDYYLNPSEKFHITFSTLIGCGSYRLLDKFYMSSSDFDQFFVIEPEIAIEINVTQIFKVSLGLGYRLVLGVNNQELKIESSEKTPYTNSDFSSPTLLLEFKFGLF